MATIQTIDIGTVANDGTGDTLRAAMDKVNDNASALNAAIIALETSIVVATIAAGTEGQVVTTESGVAVWKDPAAASFTPTEASTISTTSHSPTSGGWFTYTNVGAITITLDATLVDNGEAILVKGSGSGAITISPDAGFTINGAGSSLTLASAALVKRIGTDFTVSGGTTAAKDFDGSNLENGTLGTGMVVPEVLIVACSDENVTSVTTGTGKASFRMPFAMTLTDIMASASTAPTGAALTIDVNEAGTTILSTKITIDDGEETSESAATPAVISDAALAFDAEITIDFDQVGSSEGGKGVKVTLIGTRALA